MRRRPSRAWSGTPRAAILPGVTVEASSPALIEKVRTAVSDGTGQYRIENLRPGDLHRDVHAAGFHHRASREGVELDGLADRHRQRRAEVGGVEETITVTGETPIVDLQSAQRQTVLTNEVITAIPTAGCYNALLVLVPGHLRRPAGREHRALQLVHVQLARHAALDGGPRQSRGAAAGGRHQHRGAPGRRHELPHGHAERAGGDLHRRRAAWAKWSRAGR